MTESNKIAEQWSLYNLILEIELTDSKTFLKHKNFQKGQHILRRKQICSNLYFIESGLVKMAKKMDMKEFILRFFSEKETLTVLNSFLYEHPTKYHLIALEDTTIKYISYRDLQQLFSKYHEVEIKFNKLQAAAINQMMERIDDLLHQKPYDLYYSFLKNHPALTQRISLGDMSSYIGISQVSLSRIRARK